MGGDYCIKGGINLANCVYAQYILCASIRIGEKMKQRYNRLTAIKDLIKKNRIDNQDALLSLLKDEGFEVTQATLSRDLKMLKVGKISDGWSGYYYSLPDNDVVAESEKSYIHPGCSTWSDFYGV
mgnify:CR=1 FL=1